MESPNGKAVLTLKTPAGIALAVVSLLTGTTLPSLAAAGYSVPAWVPIAIGTLGSVLLILAMYSGGLRTKRPKKESAIPGVVANPVSPEVKP